MAYRRRKEQNPLESSKISEIKPEKMVINFGRTYNYEMGSIIILLTFKIKGTTIVVKKLRIRVFRD
ncbi:hypothetical protein K3495_g5197 [Podosphaera aphanis]|nr:hypothetical protein K3495_g5197 [Podosphaera aphanis]